MAPISAIYPSLRDKVVLITGAAEGIGAAAVELFSRQGSKVIIFDISEPSATKLIGHISTLKPWHPDFPVSIPKFYHCDVTDLGRLKGLVEEAKRDFGGVDVLINNAAAAGDSARKATMDVSPEAWEGNINVNLRHVFFLSQYVIPGMKAKGKGAIINMGSISWHVPQPTFQLPSMNVRTLTECSCRRIPAVGTPVYMAAKAAIMGLTKTHSKEFGSFGIRINSIMPGAIATERQKAEVYGPDPPYHEYCLSQQTIKRDLEPREVASVMVFLASDDASAVTGSSYVVDGGWVSDV